MNSFDCATETTEQLDALARQAFECLSGTVPSTAHTEACLECLEYRARVDYDGAECGTVLVSCDATFAFLFTEALMQVPRPCQFDDDVRDALGELVNTIGGNYKGLLGRDIHLAIPTVEVAADPSHMLHDRNPIANLTYEFDRGTCEVRLLV